MHTAVRRHRNPAFAACAAAALMLAPADAAQRSKEVHIHSGAYHPPSTTITVNTNLVELGVTVRDRKGTPVGGFHASDFQVLDNLKPQNIAFFSEQRGDAPSARPSAPPPAGQPSPETPAPATPNAQPRSIALFFDDTHSGLAGFDRSKHAAEKLIANGLHPGDRVGIFTGSGAVTLDYTADTKTLLATLASMKRRPDPSATSGHFVCPTLTAYQAYVIARHIDIRAKEIAAQDILSCRPGEPYSLALEEAQSAAESAWDELRREPAAVLDVLLIVARHLASEPGARILLMVSPGFLAEGMDRQTAAIVDTCLRHRIVINALDDEGLLSGGAESPESLGQFQGARTEWAERTLGMRNTIVQGFLADAAASTGGQFIHNNNDFNRGLETLAALPAVSYLLGFSPTDEPDGKYHKLKVTTSKAGAYEVSARPGYFATPQEKPPETVQQRIDRVAASNEPLAEISATVKVRTVADKEDRYRIQVDIALDAKGLTFSDRDRVSVQQLTFVTVLEDAQGHYVEGKQAMMDMELTSATRAELETDGIKAATSFVVPKGDYRIREVIREAVQNHLAASSTLVEVR